MPKKSTPEPIIKVHKRFRIFTSEDDGPSGMERRMNEWACELPESAHIVNTQITQSTVTGSGRTWAIVTALVHYELTEVIYPDPEPK